MELEFHEAYIEHRYRLSEESKQKQDHIVWTCVLNEVSGRTLGSWDAAVN